MAVLSAVAGEAALIRQLMMGMDDTGMILVQPTILADMLTAAALSRQHPVWLLAEDEEVTAALERALEGDPLPLAEIKRRRRRDGGGVSMEQFLKARAAAEATGREGEELVAEWLEEECDAFDWVSKKEPLSPFDMIVHGGPIAPGLNYLDVKSTKDGFSSHFHLSMGDAPFAAEADEPHRIVRVSGLRAGTPSARVSVPINEFARALLAMHEGAFPEGVLADGFIVSPATVGLRWGGPIDIEVSDDE